MSEKCKRCLLSEYNPELYYKTVVEYIDSMPIEDKVSDIEYSDRIEKCTECSNLINGMCKICGCFVEVRAIKKNIGCPSIEKVW